MKIKHLFLSVLAMASVAVACNKNEDPSSDKPSLTLNPTELTFEIAGGTQTVAVEANREWSIADADKIPSWLKVEKTSDTEITVVATGKNEGKDQTCTVTVRMVGVKKTFTVTQKGEGGEVTPVEEGDGSKEKPYSATQALAVTSALEKDAKTDKEYYVKGIVCEVKEISTQYGNATFWISDDGSNDKATRFYVFRAKDANGASITDPNRVKVGDAVVVYGIFQNYYGNTPQLSQGGQIISVNGGNPDTPEETTATGVVVATNSKGFLIKTDTGIQYVFDATITPEVAVGDNVTVKGTKTVYNGTPEITGYTVTVNSKGTEVTHPAATAITADNIATYTDLFGFVKTTGTLTISSKGYYNLAVEGATKTVSLAYPVGVDASYNGKNIDVEGYYVGLTGNGTYFNIVVTGVSLSSVQPEPEPVEDGAISLIINDISSDFTETTVDDKKGFTVTTSKGVKVTYWKAGGNSDPMAPSDLLRLYQYHSLTISVDGKKVKKVALTLNTKINGLTINSDEDKFIEPVNSVVTWEGAATSEFKCTASKAQVRIQKIVVVTE